jgi:acyl carrier protein
MEVWCICEGTGVMHVSSIYIICPKCEGAGVIQIKGEDMEEQESKQPFAYEEYVELKKQYQELRDKVWEHRSENMKMRDTVRDFFQERCNEEDYPDELTITVSEINDLLTSINATHLSKSFEATANVEITFTVVAEDKEGAEEIINDYLDSIDIFTSEGDECSVNSYDVYVTD